MRRLLSLLVTGSLSTAAAGFDFQALQTLIERQNLGSIEQLLDALPTLERGDYALMFVSRSLQGASPSNPRVILFGSDARFIITFNGDPEQRGYRMLETMEFDDGRSEFRLRELTFPEQPGGAARVLVSEVNPPRCARCHGSPPRPVWDTFPLWPGAYGERYRANLSVSERRGLTAFLARQPAHARYHSLLGVGHLADPDTFRASGNGTYAGAQREPPNARLAIALERLQSRAIVAQLERQPAFATFQYALLGLADGNCGPLVDFYPKALWQEQRAAFMRFTVQAAEANAQQERLKQARATSNSRTRGVAVDPGENVLLRLRFVAETGLGTPTGEWTLALERGTYDFTMPPVSTQPLRDALLRQVITQDPVLRELSFSATSADGDRFCTHLKRRSRAALLTAEPALTAETSAFAPGTVGSVRPAVLQLCIGCHESGVAPELPFSHPAQLAQALRTQPTAHGTLIDEIEFRLSPQAGAQRMPLGINLADGERQQLEDYFLAVAASLN